MKETLKNLLRLKLNNWRSWLGLVIGISWLIVCAVSGALFLEFLFEQVPDIIGSLIPLYFALWVTVLFLGRWVLRKLVSPILH